MKRAEEFLKDIPEEYNVRIPDKNFTLNEMYFSDRIGGTKWQPKFYDFAIALLSNKFLEDEESLHCLGRA